MKLLVVALFVLAAAIGANADCSCSDDCQVFKEKKNYGDAQKDCQTRGGELVKVDTIDQDIAVKALLDAEGVGNAWLNGKRSGSSNIFVHNDGSLIRTANWNNCEPNDWGGSEDCLEYRGKGWNDINCGAQSAYVCEF